MLLAQRHNFEHDNVRSNDNFVDMRVFAPVSDPRYGIVIKLRNGETYIIEDEDG